MNRTPESEFVPQDVIIAVEVKVEVDDGFVSIIPDILCPGRNQDDPQHGIYPIETLAKENLQRRTDDFVSQQRLVLPEPTLPLGASRFQIQENPMMVGCTVEDTQGEAIAPNPTYIDSNNKKADGKTLVCFGRYSPLPCNI